jgi:hypothetical protein
VHDIVGGDDWFAGEIKVLHIEMRCRADRVQKQANDAACTSAACYPSDC